MKRIEMRELLPWKLDAPVKRVNVNDSVMGESSLAVALETRRSDEARQCQGQRDTLSWKRELEAGVRVKDGKTRCLGNRSSRQETKRVTTLERKTP
ncbi:hypothetical protein NDU88_003555 [Pleurodeles waltl]|uniref:Uncharacterized protein n=1 Tax=Pleurodeles waltl TaxID=8319 RepID=A0AAV7V0D9_PLEWA|nr:hypothetical protein NDU88_003555 [Pleurodeles waltl]